MKFSRVPPLTTLSVVMAIRRAPLVDMCIPSHHTNPSDNTPLVLANAKCCAARPPPHKYPHHPFHNPNDSVSPQIVFPFFYQSYSRSRMAIHHVRGWAAQDESGILSPFSFTRRATGPNDVAFKVTHCGICHTDLHQIHNGWNTAKYPMVPGHEIVGIVEEVGSNVKNFKVGDHVGVGFLVESCEECECCKSGQEQYCDKSVWSYNGVGADGNVTFGGFSSLMVADYRFVLHVPENLPLYQAAPLLCAGVTIYSPMKYYGMTEKGKHLGIVGLGGLGHMAVKFGKAFGLETTIISTSPSKEKEAREVLGADHFLISKDEKSMQEAKKTLDFIIDTVSAVHPLEPLLSLLKHDGKLVLVGLPEKPLALNATALIFGGRHTIGASLIGGIGETQEMLDFCGEHDVRCMVETVPMAYANTAMKRLQKGDVRYRFVIDVEKSFDDHPHPPHGHNN